MPIEFLMFPGCPRSGVMLDNLRSALKQLEWPVAFLQVNVEQLHQDDPRRAYGCPSVLIDGNDLMGDPVPPLPRSGCREYAGFADAPSVEELVRRLAPLGARRPRRAQRAVS